MSEDREAERPDGRPAARTPEPPGVPPSDRPVWVLASANRHKHRELAELLAEAPVTLLPLPAGIELPEETGTTLVANARLKARAAAAATGHVALADDTGLEVDALGGEPGVRSSRYAGAGGDYAANTRLLLERLRGIHGVNRRARFRCAVVLAAPEGKEITAQGTVEGFILDAPRGSEGFGYDPLFLVEGTERTLAELASEEKNAISHRGRALAKLMDDLRRLGRWVP